MFRDTVVRGVLCLVLCAVSTTISSSALLAAPAEVQSLQSGTGTTGWVLEARAGAATLRHGELRQTLSPGGSAEFSDLAARGDAWMVAGNRKTITGRSNLFVYLGQGDRRSELEMPPSVSHDRVAPVLLVQRSEAVASSGQELLSGLDLQGVAWLEGAGRKRYGVWFSAWSGDRLASPELVSPAGKGSQLALRGAALEDGSVLLVWTAFDGEDDEVFWSVRRPRVEPAEGARWSQPKRVSTDNRVPDIVPDLMADPDGARLVWSRYDGNDYRLMAAAFRSGSWSEPKVLGGPGSVYPRFLDGNEAGVVFFSASDVGWRLIELDPGIEVVRSSAVLELPAGQRPVIESVDSAGVRFSVPEDSVTGGPAVGNRVPRSVLPRWAPSRSVSWARP